MIDYRPSIYKAEKEKFIDGNFSISTKEKLDMDVKKIKEVLPSFFIDGLSYIGNTLDMDLKDVVTDSDFNNFFNGSIFDKRQEAVTEELNEIKDTIVEELYLGDEVNIEEMDNAFIEAIENNKINSKNSIRILKLYTVISEYISEIEKGIEHTDNLKIDIKEVGFSYIDEYKLKPLTKTLNQLNSELEYSIKSSGYNTVNISLKNCIKGLSNSKALLSVLDKSKNPYVLKILGEDEEDFNKRYESLIKSYIYMKDINNTFNRKSTELFEILKSVFGDNI